MPNRRSPKTFSSLSSFHAESPSTSISLKTEVPDSILKFSSQWQHNGNHESIQKVDRWLGLSNARVLSPIEA